ncbi:G-protein coupled bile acid receptor 1 [Eublepharis macularius]|uniref:G-protein coupled bile acid receptor 1 n=1 Tax=Eublepharis macularius TaxID=481883 RepID=A0AA97IZA3_EUBMA|nr:G-protein coupled bile acid receptor 1 [Eublepharis macularius]
MGNSLAGNKFQELIFWLTRPLSVIIILANLFIILGIVFNRKLHGAINWFFLSLLFADLLAGAALPTVPQLAFENELGYHYCFFIYVAPNFLFLSFLGNLLVVHYAKYVCIIHPLHYHNSWVYRWAAFYILLAWTAPLIFACLPLIWNQWQPHLNCSFSLVFPMPYLYLETYGILIPSILAMAFMCIQVLCIARKQLKNIARLLHSVNRGQAPSALEQQLELRNAKGIAGVSLIFLVCWVPYIACLNISLLAIDYYYVNPHTLTIVTCLGNGSAAAVPIFLSLSNHQYIQFWRDMVCGGCCKGQKYWQKQAMPNAKMPHGNLCILEPNGIQGYPPNEDFKPSPAADESLELAIKFNTQI